MATNAMLGPIVKCNIKFMQRLDAATEQNEGVEVIPLLDYRLNRSTPFSFPYFEAFRPHKCRLTKDVFMTTNGVLTIRPVAAFGTISLTTSLLLLRLAGGMELATASSLNVADIAQLAKQRTAAQPIAGSGWLHPPESTSSQL